MEVYREIINIENNTLNLQLPKNFKNGKFEVIVLPVDSAKETKKKPSDYLGCLPKEDASKMLRRINKSRKEWERDI